MIPITVYKDKRVALFGLGITGLSAAMALQSGGARLVVWDENEERCAEAASRGFEVLDLANADWNLFDAFLLSPGVPLTHPEPHWTVKMAQAANVPVIGDTELFFKEFLLHGENDRVLVITGTNGKSTTTALTAHILNEAGENAVMGGNIGFGVLDMPAFGSCDDRGGTVYVLELSSYQIDLTPSLCPSAAGLLNISPDHIDRHGTVEHYAEVKAKVFANLGVSQLAVISLDDAYCQKIALGLPTEVDTFFVGSTLSMDVGAFLEEGGFSLINRGEVIHKIDLSSASHLRGVHNSQNAAFALLLALKVSNNVDGLVAGLNSFPGLQHRMQQIDELTEGERRLLFVNDSKATNAEASEQALNSFSEIYWIAGGQAKEGGIEGLVSHLGEGMGAIKKAFLIGEAAEGFGKTLEGASVPFEICGDMKNAVSSAIEAGLAVTSGEAAVLLSPAAASFDQYPNFEVRGDAFCQIVNELLPEKDGA